MMNSICGPDIDNIIIDYAKDMEANAKHRLNKYVFDNSFLYVALPKLAGRQPDNPYGEEAGRLIAMMVHSMRDTISPRDISPESFRRFIMIAKKYNLFRELNNPRIYMYVMIS